MIVHKIKPSRGLRKLRVAAYARVSTEMDGQRGSLRTQSAYYRHLIEQNPDWKLVEVYVEDGKSGTNAEHRPEFQRMIEAALTGKIDLILTKNVARFARNAADAQRYVHELKQHNVEVRFEREGISTDDPAADMLFGLAAVAAQEESRVKSERIKWSYRVNAEKGIRHIGNNRVLGYDEVDGQLTPNGDAWIIARVFELYTNGMPVGQVAKTLAAEGARPLRGKGQITAQTVYKLLRNELYVGDRTLQKEAPQHYMTKRPDPTASYNSHFISGNHEGIVSRDVWSKAQTMIAKANEERMLGVHRTGSEQHFLYGRVFCADCGAPYVRRTLQSHDGSYYKAWNCRERQKGRKGNGCKNRIVKEEELLRCIVEESGTDKLDEGVFRNEMIRVMVDRDGICLRTKEMV